MQGSGKTRNDGNGNGMETETETEMEMEMETHSSLSCARSAVVPSALIKAHYRLTSLFPDYTEEGGLPSIKLAVYSNIQKLLKGCQL